MAKREEYYVFTMPGDMCPVWVEMFTDAGHFVAPSPQGTVAEALAWLRCHYPSDTVDELDQESDLVEVREWARTMPLEPIPA